MPLGIARGSPRILKMAFEGRCILAQRKKLSVAQELLWICGPIKREQEVRPLSRSQFAYFLRWRIFARMRRFFRPSFLLPLPLFFTPTNRTSSRTVLGLVLPSDCEKDALGDNSIAILLVSRRAIHLKNQRENRNPSDSSDQIGAVIHAVGPGNFSECPFPFVFRSWLVLFFVGQDSVQKWVPRTFGHVTFVPVDIIQSRAFLFSFSQFY